jgi:MSHA biogenesis protein MshK
MDEAVITTTRRPASAARRLAACAALLALLANGAGAQALQDPTKPPAAATPAPVGAAAGNAASGPQLQSILIGRAAGGRHVAVIDGETVRPGEMFHGAKVARIGENEVVLVRGGERQVLRLYADAVDGRDRPGARNARR